MSCLTCEVTPPDEKTSPDRVGPHHIGHRFGDSGLGLAVLYRGHDVTLQTVEAVAGEDGWVEMRLMTDDGGPVLHPAAEPRCPACGGPRERFPVPGDITAVRWTFCPCGNTDMPMVAYGPHVVTVIRQGAVQIVRGAELINGPEDQAETTDLGSTTPSYLPTG